MKNLGLLCFIFILFSCSMTTTITKEEIKEETSEYKIDVVESFIDCDKNSEYKTIEPINTRMGELVDSLIYDLKSAALEQAAHFDHPPFQYQLMVTDTIFNISQEIISTRLTAYIFAGGAHGKTEFYAVNYSPKKLIFLSTGDIFDLNKTKEINTVIAKYFVNPERCFSTTPTLETATTVNISKTSVIFTYAHYTLGAYYCGSAVVEVPLKEIKDYINI